MSRTKPADKGRYIKIVLALIGSTKPAVVYDCALTLTALSQVCGLRQRMKLSCMACTAICLSPCKVTNYLMLDAFVRKVYVALSWQGER